jgi:hypothetical protein
VEEFKNKSMAIVGYESDQVQKHPDGTETRVPITWQYNHHYGPILTGRDVQLAQIKLDGPNDPRDPKTGHPNPDGTAWIVAPACAQLGGDWHDLKSRTPIHIAQDGCKLTGSMASNTGWSPAPGTVKGDAIQMRFLQDVFNGTYNPNAKPCAITWSNGAIWEQGAATPGKGPHIPTSQTFYIGNGGEYRKSHHGMPPGAAQVLHAPNLFHIQPMQIDTKNRDGSMERPEQGFTPGIYPKAAVAPRTGPDATYSGLLECPCTDRIQKVYTPTWATQHVGNCSTGSERPAKTADECFAAAVQVGIAGANHSGVSTTLPPGCSATIDSASGSASVFFNSAGDSVVPCGGGLPVHLVGTASSSVNVSLVLDIDAKTDTVTITISGPDSVWMGVGFGATAMSALPYTIVIDGAGNISEHKLGNHDPGTVLSSSLKVISNSVSGSPSGRVREVVMTRALKGATPQHFTFDPSVTRVSFIAAVGSSSAYSYHKSKTASSLSLVAVDAPQCICDHPAPFGSTKGSLVYTGPVNYTTDPRRESQTLGFNKNCKSEPHADLLHQRNPTCDLHTYQGGLSCCHHLWLLTDKGQEKELSPDIFEYFIKFRFYFQNWSPKTATKPASHQNVVRLYHQTEDAASEYDIHQCNLSTTAPGDCVQQITAHFQVKEMLSPAHVQPIFKGRAPVEDGSLSAVQMNDTGVKILFAGGHCHAPSCVSLELYNADTGALICRQIPVIGQTLHPDGDANGTAYDEKGYVAIPPCLWGDLKYGLEPAVLLTWETNLTSIKRNNNTHAHLGEMASWQMRGYATR